VGNLKLKDIGEFGIIDKISRTTKLSRSVIKGIGDDCAVIRYTKDRNLLYTTDMIIEDIHFKRNASAESIGHKALAVNISDIAACGGTPKWAVVSAGVPSDIDYNFISGINRGIKKLAGRFNIDIVGGDTNLSKKIVISIALLGEVKKQNLLLRSGAKNKDMIVLTGPLCKRPNDLTFCPKVKESKMLASCSNINSMIDISDGLLSDLSHILDQSKKGAILYESLIPCKPKSASAEGVLNIGEQFELLFTLPSKDAKRLPKGFYPIGQIREKGTGITYVSRQGRQKKISPAGYSHF